MADFTCECGTTYGEGDVPPHADGLLKSLYAQVALESFQAKELADLFASDANRRKEWIEDKFGPDFPVDGSNEELIEDFLYKSHRQDGCTATFHCPNCGRLATLSDVSENWRFYKPDGHV